MFSHYYDFSPNGIYMQGKLDYLNSLYPSEIKELKSLVTTELDKMDYPGSMIYDECPDQVMFSKKCGEICSVAKCNCKYGKKCENDNFLRDLIKVILINEITDRRQHQNKPARPEFGAPCHGSCGNPPMGKPPFGRPPMNRPPFGSPDGRPPMGPPNGGRPDERPPFRPIPPEYMR